MLKSAPCFWKNSHVPSVALCWCVHQAIPRTYGRRQLHWHFARRQQVVDRWTGQHRTLMEPHSWEATRTVRLQLSDLLSWILSHRRLAGCWVRPWLFAVLFAVMHRQWSSSFSPDWIQKFLLLQQRRWLLDFYVSIFISVLSRCNKTLSSKYFLILSRWYV